MNQVTTIDHPLVQHKLTLMRDRNTSSAKFRALLSEISHLLAYEVTRDLELRLEEIETPLVKTKAPVLKSSNLVLVSILRAGNGILDGMLSLIPTAQVGHIGLYRDSLTQVVVEYYFKLPHSVKNKTFIVIDPMLATGHTAVAAVNRILPSQPGAIKFVCLLASPVGLKTFSEEHPKVPIYTVAIDEKLDENNYIVPGIGDVGDRLFGTLK